MGLQQIRLDGVYGLDLQISLFVEVSVKSKYKYFEAFPVLPVYTTDEARWYPTAVLFLALLIPELRYHFPTERPLQPS